MNRPTTPSKSELEARLAPYGQQHLLAFWETLAPAQRQRLAEQILAIDFSELARLFADAGSAIDWAALARRAQPPPAIRLDDAQPAYSREAAVQRGEEALRNGRLGVILVAGGQGTRLGFDAPKGLFPIGPVSGASLLRILIEKLRAVASRYDVSIPLYLMTSPATHAPTEAFLEEHERFGLARSELVLFCQGTMPAVDADSGHVLLAAPDAIALSPDGHGGMLAALKRSRAWSDIEHRGIEQLFYMQVDNPLVHVCDPALVGYHLLAGSEASTQVVAKHAPEDRVGNVVALDGGLRIIEYSDLPRDVARLREPDGSLRFWAGSIAVHVFDVALLARAADDPAALPFHRAQKKVPHIDSEGNLVEPAQPNAIKFERFIFDLLPVAQGAMVVEVDEARNFAPLKNAPGSASDAPEHVHRRMVELYREWLREAGASVDQGVAVEISPLFALDAAELRTRIEPGLRVTADRYFC